MRSSASERHTVAIGQLALCREEAYTIGMESTPEAALELFAQVSTPLVTALSGGIAYADSLQELDADDFDAHFHAASARFQARRELRSWVMPGGWQLRDDLANSGIEVILPSGDRIRVLRSEGSVTPSSGRSYRRTAEYEATQLALNLGMSSPLRLIADWEIGSDRMPIVSLGLPLTSWRYGQLARLAWRVAIDVRVPLRGGRFSTRDSDISVDAVIEIEDGESGDL